MSYQVQSLGSFLEPKEVSRTYHWYNVQVNSPLRTKRGIHKKYYAMLKKSKLI